MIDDDDAGPWTKVTDSLDEYAAGARANLDAQEEATLAQVREMFAGFRTRLETDLVRVAHDLSVQRGALPGAPPADVH